MWKDKIKIKHEFEKQKKSKKNKNYLNMFWNENKKKINFLVIHSANKITFRLSQDEITMVVA